MAIAKFEKVSLKEWNHSTGDFLNESYKDIKLPVRKTKGSAGYDFIAPFDIHIQANGSVRFPSGIKCKINGGYVLELYPRSSLGFKYGLQLDNTVGIIDSDYYGNKGNEGHIQVKMTSHHSEPIVIKKGEAYMQGIFKKYYLAEEEEVTTERTGGLGSTNKKGE